MPGILKTYKIAIIITGFSFLLWMVSLVIPWVIDMTEDDRYSLSPSTEELVNSHGEQVLVEVLYAGDLPAGYKKLEIAVKDLLRKFRSINPRISYRFMDPLEGDEEEVNKRMEQFSKMGLIPFPIRFESDSEFKAIQAFPYVIFSQKNKNVVVNIIEGSVVGNYSEENLNKAITQLEYKFANALQKITQEKRKTIGFLTGHGEFTPQESYMLESELRRYYYTKRIDLDSTLLVPGETNLLIVSSPKSEFQDKHIFALDHYVNRGGNIIWMIDMIDVANDSIDKYGEYIPPSRNLGLESLFFRYGVRFNTDLILDLESSTIPIVTAAPSGQPQIELFPWYYHGLNAASENHPLTSGVDRVNLFYPSTIDTLETLNLSKDILLSTSQTTIIQQLPVKLNFEILRYPPDPQRFDQNSKATAVLVQGAFRSFFHNKLSNNYQQTLSSRNTQISEYGIPSKQLFISDADFVKTHYIKDTGEPLPLGYNKGERKKYKGNENFILNAVEYMMGDGSILASKSKTRKLWLIDKAKVAKDKTWWQIVNILFPLLFLITIGLLYNFLEKRNMPADRRIKPIHILMVIIVAFSTTSWMVSNEEWGFFGHRKINRYAVFTCPPSLIGFYKKHIDYLTEHAIDPDKRRHASVFEAIRHYIDIDHWDNFPFESVPRNYMEAILKYGRLIIETEQGVKFNCKTEILPDSVILVSPNGPVYTFQKDTFFHFFYDSIYPLRYTDDFHKEFEHGNSLMVKVKSISVRDSFSQFGILPYSLLESHSRLIRAFEEENEGAILKLSADYGHYIADAHVPLHTTENYNGQLTGQDGIHAFWESRLPELFAEKEYDFFVGKARYIENLKDYYWDIILESNASLDKVLGEEKRLRKEFPKDRQYCYDERNGRTVRIQCPEFSKAYHMALGNMVEERFRSAIQATGNLWYTAWVQAGKPDLQDRVVSYTSESFDTIRVNGRPVGRSHN